MPLARRIDVKLNFSMMIIDADVDRGFMKKAKKEDRLLKVRNSEMRRE